jgi:uncharacterized protein (DUF2164 family)
VQGGIRSGCFTEKKAVVELLGIGYYNQCAKDHNAIISKN